MAGSKWSSERPETRPGGPCRKVKSKGENNDVEKREGERVVEKAAGDECVFIPGRGLDWQMPDAAGGEGGHGTEKTSPGFKHRS
jgi:hypothetical protein